MIPAKPSTPSRREKKKRRPSGRPGSAGPAAAAPPGEKGHGAAGKELRVLVYGIGNPGRRDDGLGVELARRAAEFQIGNLDCDSDYQLNVEDAETISHYDVVVFADAARDLDNPFEFRELEPSREIPFTTHELPPASVLALSRDLFAGAPKAFILAVRGYRFEVQEGMTRKAEKNLNLALNFLSDFLRRL